MIDFNVFAIVVTYNGEKWIEKCINSLITSSHKIQVVVIDNGSTDNSVKIISSFPDVKLILSSSNLGFGKANNIGIRYALQNNAHYLFLLNQDAWIDYSTVKELIEVSTLNSNFGIISPVHLNWDGDELDWYFLEMVSSSNCPNFINDLYFGKQKSIYECKFIHAACWLIPISCIVKVGLFDPIFPHYGEDNNYFQRVIYKGLKCAISPQSKVFHFGRNKNNNKSKNEIYFKVINNLVYLTNPSLPLWGNLFLLLKSIIFSFLDIFFTRRISPFIRDCKVFFKTLFYLPQIFKSRKIYKSDSPFL